MGRLHLALLGVPDVRHEGHVLAFPARKALALLAYLAVEGGLHSREQLVGLLWPEADESSARASLRTALARLRAALGATSGEHHLAAERDLLGLVPGPEIELDLAWVEAAYDQARAVAATGGSPAEDRPDLIAHWEAARHQCRGEFLEGISLPDAPDFEEWVRLQREAWQQRMTVVLDCLSRFQAEEGQVASARETTALWLRFSPLDERAHRRLIELHLAAGDRSAALQAYETCRRRLAQELGVRPAPETAALAQRIRDGRGRRSGMDAAPAAGRAVQGPVAPPARLSLHLTGRAAEFAHLVELFYLVTRGQPQVIVLQGEAGIGKTRLATEFLEWAGARGATILQGRAFETGGQVPYQAVVDALRPPIERENAPEDLLGDTWLAELSRLLPELRDRYPDLALPTGEDAAARTRLFEAVARLGQALARRSPLVVFVDDIQWADAATLDVLRHAAARWGTEKAPVLLILAFRVGEVTADRTIEHWLRDLRRGLASTRLELAPLSADETRDLVLGATLGGPESDRLAHWLYAETGGQPFFLVETLQALRDRGLAVPRRRTDGTWALAIAGQPTDRAALPDGTAPGFLAPGVRELIQARLDGLTPTARELLTAAAVLGPRDTFELTCRVAEVGENAGLTALDEVLRGQLLREVAGPELDQASGLYTFAHDKIREVVYEEAGLARRRVFHRRALAALHDLAPAAELAYHALAAGLADQALELSIRAGEEAQRLLAARDAAAQYGQAIRLAERLDRRDLLADLDIRQARALVAAGLWAEARPSLDRAIARLGADQPERRAELLIMLQQACYWLLDIPGLRSAAAEALDLAERLGRVDLDMITQGWLGRADAADGDLESSIDRFEKATAWLSEHQHDELADLQPPQTQSLYWRGRYEEAIRYNREAIRLAQATGDPASLVVRLTNLGLALTGAGHYAEARRSFAEAQRFSREYGVGGLGARAVASSAVLHLDLFDLDRAEAISREARELARTFDFAPAQVSAGIDLLLALARRGDVSRVEGLLEEADAAAERTAGFHGWLWQLRLAEARAEIAIARGEWPTAVQWADEAIRLSRQRGRVKYQALGLGSRAGALHGLGRTKEAIENLREALGLAHAIGAPALCVRPAADLLRLAGDDTLAGEARAVVEGVLAEIAEVPDPELRRRFEASEPVQTIIRLAPPGHS